MNAQNILNIVFNE